MTGKQLKNSILQWAIQGKLVPQDPNDEPASVLLEKIRQEKERLIKEKKIKRDKNASIIFRGENNSYYEKFLATGEVKCIDEEIPFEIPQGWEWCKINNIAFVTKLAGFEYTKYISNNLQTTGIPLFKGKNVQGGKIVYDFEAFIPESLSDELERSQISKKCLLTPYVGTIGNIGIHNKPGKYHLGSNVGKIEILNPGDETCILEEFLHIYLLSHYGYAELTKYKKATAQESISIDAIREVLVPIPSIQKQKEIVDKYYELEPIVDKYNKSQDTLYRLNAEIFANLKKSILQEAIQGKLVPQIAEEGTARELLEQIRQEKERLIKEKKIKRDKNASIIFRGEDNSYYEKFLATGEVKCIDEEIPFEIPQGWEWCRFSSIYWQLTDGTHSTPKYTQSGIPFLSVKDMSTGRLSFANTKFISEEEHKLLSQRCHPCKGNLLLSKVGTTGIPLIIDDDREFSIFVSLALIKFFPKFVDSSFLIALLNSPLVQMQVKEDTRGVGNKNWVLTAISNTLLAIPPLREQQRIVEKIDILSPYTDKIERLFEQLK